MVNRAQLAASLAALFQQYHLASFRQHCSGSANLATPDYKRTYKHNLSTSRFADKNSSVSSNSTGEVSESTP
ncbi:hypothetical protein, partial [Lancefieldella rimae]|uniref:hypothetical protein n=1 Tax=Lancefieldella rimae TaxID=1383 RepID=UPI0028807BB9